MIVRAAELKPRIRRYCHNGSWLWGLFPSPFHRRPVGTSHDFKLFKRARIFK